MCLSLTSAGIVSGVLFGLTLTAGWNESADPGTSQVTPNEIQKQFDVSFFEGVWRIEGEVLLDPNGATAKVSGAAHAKWNDGRTALDETSELTFPDGKQKVNVSSLSYNQDKNQLLLKTPPEIGQNPVEKTATVAADADEFEFVDYTAQSGPIRMKVKIVGPSQYTATMEYTLANGETKEAVKLHYSRIKV